MEWYLLAKNLWPLYMIWYYISFSGYILFVDIAIQVDDSRSTLLSTGKIISAYFGTTLEFFSYIESTMSKVRISFYVNCIINAQTDSLQIMMDGIEDINEHHVSAWTEMLEKSKPPIHNTPLTAYMDRYTLEKKIVSLDNSKIKTIVGYELLKPKFNHDTIKEVVDKWKEEGIWPNLDWFSLFNNPLINSYFLQG